MHIHSGMVKHNPKRTSCVILFEEVAEQDNGKKKMEISLADDGTVFSYYSSSYGSQLRIECCIYLYLYIGFVISEKNSLFIRV